MKKKDDLFRLVQSMTPSEKRYFKVFAQGRSARGENNYILLFDAIADQREYDENKIRHELRSKKFVRQLDVTKHYLYELVLKSLSAFNVSQNIDAQLRELLSQVEILHSKGLHAQAYKVVKTLKEKAEACSRYAMHYEALRWEAVLSRLLPSPGNSTVIREKRELLKTIGKVTDYIELDMDIVDVLSKDTHLRSRLGREMWQRVMKDPLLKETDDKLPFEARILFHEMNGWACYYRGKWKKAAHHFKCTTIEFERSPGLVKAFPDIFMGTFNNLAAAQVRVVSQEEVWNTLSRFEELAKGLRDPQSQMNVQLFVLNRKLQYYSLRGPFAEGLQFAGEVERYLKQNRTRVPPDYFAILYYRISYICFGVGEYKKALKRLNTVFHETPIKNYPSQEVLTLMLRLAVYFQLGEYDLLSYQVVSVYRLLKRRNRLYEMESALLSFIRNELPKLSIHRKQQRKKVIEKLRDRLVVISRAPHERLVFDQFDVISWLTSLVTNKSFEQCVIENKY